MSTSLPPDPIPVLNRALAERYAIHSVIGQGGMGTVYRAQDLRHDRTVAIKVLRPELGGAVGAERFLREIRLTAQLDHPHIVPLLDSGEADGTLFYVMPLVEGESLRDRLTRDGPLPLDEALRIAREVAGALAHAHARGIVHRDIKPENVLLSGGHARVMDFGIARALSAAGGEGLTGTGLAIGTPAYMSPEQAAGSTDLRSDVYSVGCVLYEMLAGRPPFAGSAPHELLARHALDPVPTLAAARPGLPPFLDRAIARCLAKAPADRFGSAAELKEALVAGEVSSGASAGGQRRRSRLAAGAGAVILLVLAAALLRARNGREPSASSLARTSIAVLPFENLSAENRYSYFAGGLHDELLTQLSKVSALRVISRTSVMRFATARPSLREIAAELGVGSVVEGTVQAEGGRLRVNVQLIDAATDAHLWAERYDRTLDDAFAIQSDVARQIVTAVGAALSSAESRGIAEVPTSDPEAYRLYLQAHDYWTRPGRHPEDYLAAEQLLDQALRRDSSFALAHAALAEVHALTFLLRYDPSPGRIARAMASAETAVRLAPGLPRAHEAVGIAYAIGRRDYEQALQAFLESARGQPNDPRLWQRIGFSRRMLGQWDSALAAFTRSTELDPHDADMFFHLGLTQELVRHYDDALRTLAHAQRLAPDLRSAAVSRGWILARWRGELDTLAHVLKQMPTSLSLGPLGNSAAHAMQLQHWRRDPDAMDAVLQQIQSDAIESELSYQPVALYAGWARRLQGDGKAARGAFEQAQRVVADRLARTPDDWRVIAASGLIFAALGLRDSALAAAGALDAAFQRERGYLDLKGQEERARILAQVGDADGAVETLKPLLDGPGWVTREVLRLDPLWDPIRQHPRFRALLGN